ncbi:hypothetical protein [Jiella mangrovi]|uniref:hypothetical protein n=1 Tax=Jiella mangrovi TaxID=2821407 RepID=UPI001FD82F4B|nr:hypothetical protein [Jiella mangrovi]
MIIASSSTTSIRKFRLERPFTFSPLRSSTARPESRELSGQQRRKAAGTAQFRPDFRLANVINDAVKEFNRRSPRSGSIYLDASTYRIRVSDASSPVYKIITEDNLSFNPVINHD